MNDYYKDKYLIPSIRIKDFDYADGEYFVTICTKDREVLFGEVQGGDIQLSEEGKIAEKFWKEIPLHFPNLILDEFVIMPNHVHGIVIIDNHCDSERRDAINRVSTSQGAGGITGVKNPMLNKGTLPFIIRWFKGRSAFEIRKINSSFNWQPRYYEHVIRDQKSFLNIQDYIAENPLKWAKDENNPVNINNKK
ncbi:MAG: hypothetical protein K2X86_04215 [Cytophagaceae bacterium]|nr:hypothetical protein [Cytophagaceae bacterium]